MKKIYEAQGSNFMRLIVKYCGVNITFDFTNGDVRAGRPARYVTDNPFFQDALEQDPRHGSEYRLTKVFSDEGESPVAPVRRASGKASTEEAKETKPANSRAMEFDNKNEAFAYFMNRGETVSNEEDLKKLLKRYKATIKAED